MWRDIRKWWMLLRLRRRYLEEIIKLPRSISNTPQLFGLPKDAGSNSFVDWVSRHSLTWLPLWDKFRPKMFNIDWKKPKNEKKLRKREQDHRTMINSMVGKEVDEWADTQGVVRIKVSDNGIDELGIFPILQKLLSKYYLAWTVIIIPLLVGAYGSPVIKSWLKLFWDLIKSKLK